MLRRDYYTILGVSRSESASGVRTAFRELARRYHPERVGPRGTRFLIDEKIPFSFRENGNVRGFSLGLKDAVSSEITNHHEQVQSHANDEYRNAEQDANSEAPYPEPLPEIERDTQQSDYGAANSGSRQPGLVGLF